MNRLNEIGPVERFLSDDHRRLESLLQKAVKDPDRPDRDAYGAFRAGLLRHISMEEKVLLPAGQRLCGGNPLPISSRLRLDHGALAVLLVPSPTPEIVAVIRSILQRHNKIEEGEGGLYATCDRVFETGPEDLVAKLQRVPEVPVSTHNDGPKVMAAVCRALQRAGYYAEAERLLAR